MKFKDKVVWITGASSGIGRALAIELSKQSVKLILSSRNESALKNVKQLCSINENVKILPLDLEKLEELEVLTKKAIALFGTIDVLFNNGGISQRSLAEETSIEVDKKIMDINYLGTIALTKALLPHFIEKKSGYFVITSSIVGKVATPLRSSYSASKHALHGFFDSLRAEVYKHHIKVIIACPGFICTNVSINALTGDGSPQNTMDKATEKGMSSEVFVKKLISAVQKEKNEVYIGGFKEKLAVLMQRISPNIVAKMIKKMAVT